MSAATSPEFSIAGIRLDGGRPCLNFVNTIHDRFAAVPADYLAAPAQYREWCVRAALLSRHEAERLTVTAGVLAEARNFREHLHALLSARIDGTAVPASSLRHCDRWLHQAWSTLTLDPASLRGGLVAGRGARRPAAPQAHRIVRARGAQGRAAAAAQTLRVGGLLRLAVLRRQQGRPAALVLHGGLRHRRENAPLPPQLTRGTG